MRTCGRAGRNDVLTSPAHAREPRPVVARAQQGRLPNVERARARL